MRDRTQEYYEGYKDCFMLQQIKISKIIKLTENYMQKYDGADDLMIELYKIASEICD
jgi:hypothetical protein